MQEATVAVHVLEAEVSLLVFFVEVLVTGDFNPPNVGFGEAHLGIEATSKTLVALTWGKPFPRVGLILHQYPPPVVASILPQAQPNHRC
jgi:hypothetical protein